MNDWTHLGASGVPEADIAAVLARGRQLQSARTRRRRVAAVAASALTAMSLFALVGPSNEAGTATDSLGAQTGFVMPTNEPRAQATAMPTDDKQDDEPGWYDPSTGTTCRPTTVSDTPTAPPAPGLELTVEAPAGPVRAGAPITTRLRIANRSAQKIDP